MLVHLHVCSGSKALLKSTNVFAVYVSAMLFSTRLFVLGSLSKALLKSIIGVLLRVRIYLSNTFCAVVVVVVVVVVFVVVVFVVVVAVVVVVVIVFVYFFNVHFV
jgi:hypothetical protein